MGAVFSYVGLSTNKGVKRQIDESDDESAACITPSSKRMRLTSNYIYETLFVEGEGSDITVTALGRQWHLHKIYLKQCAYFSSMFSGSWRETNYSKIDIVTPDPCINTAALDVAFMSLYKDDVMVTADRAVSVLAAATLLQLESLREHCSIVMKEKLKASNVVSYLNAARTYGLPDIADQCSTWLQQNLMSRSHSKLLVDISVELMTDLITSPYLYVTQLETDIYTLLKKWMFLCLHPELVDADDIVHRSDQYYENRKNESTACMLLTDEGWPYIPAFQVIRWHFVINEAKSLHMVQTDAIVPVLWLTPVFTYLLQHMLLIDSAIDNGPPRDLDEQVFNDTSFRCGRLMTNNCRYHWRWVGYNYGIDLLFTCHNGLLTLTRNSSFDSPGATSHRPVRSVTFRITMASLDNHGRCKYHQTSSIQHLDLNRNQEVVVFIIDPQISFPANLNVNMLTYNPGASTTRTFLAVPQDRCSFADSSTQTETLMSTLPRSTDSSTDWLARRRSSSEQCRESSDTLVTRPRISESNISATSSRLRENVRRRLTVDSSSSSDEDNNEKSLRVKIKEIEARLINSRSAINSSHGDIPDRTAVNAEADGVNAEADGVNAEADGVNAEADGVNAEADGVNAEADGFNAEADGVNAEADGFNAEADGFNAEADGVNAEPDDCSSHSIESDTVADTRESDTGMEASHVRVNNGDDSD